MTSSTRTPPWKKRNPRTASKRTLLSPEEKAKARARARRAGRPYPNLIDNMHVAAEKTRASKRTPARKTAKKAVPGTRRTRTALATARVTKADKKA